MRTLVAVSLAIGLLAGCGGGEEKGSGAARPGSPQELLRRVGDAIRQAGSYHIEGTQVDKNGRGALSADVTEDRLRLSLREAGRHTEMIVPGGAAIYVRGNRAFWKHSGASAQLQEVLVGRWVKGPANAELRELADLLAPGRVADCLGEQVGTLRRRRGTLDGMPVYVIVDKGDKPGTTPTELYVAAEGAPLPMRELQLGPRRAGGPPPSPKCDAESATPARRSDLRLSRFGEDFAIEAPPDALDLQQLAAQAAPPTAN